MHRLFVFLMVVASATVAAAGEVRSPDGEIRVDVSIADRDVPVYRVTFRDEVIVADSRLGLRFADHAGFDDGFRIESVEAAQVDDQWEQPWGERRLVTDRHNEILVTFESIDDPARTFKLRVRAFDDGIGFRYEVPEQEGLDDVRIVDELTEFSLPQDATAWWAPGFSWNRYEYLYRNTGIDAIRTAVTPMTFRLPSGVHASLHEAALVDYPGYVLDQRRAGIFKTNLTPASDGIRARKRTPFTTPWRTIQVAGDAAGLIDSTLILNLNEPNRLGDVSWVEPGKYVGIWWAMHHPPGGPGVQRRPEHGATTEETRRYMDFAAEHGFRRRAGRRLEYVGWDGDWFHNGDGVPLHRAVPGFRSWRRSPPTRSKTRASASIGHHETSGQRQQLRGPARWPPRSTCTNR